MQAYPLDRQDAKHRGCRDAELSPRREGRFLASGRMVNGVSKAETGLARAERTEIAREALWHSGLIRKGDAVSGEPVPDPGLKRPAYIPQPRDLAGRPEAGRHRYLFGGAAPLV